MFLGVATPEFVSTIVMHGATPTHGSQIAYTAILEWLFARNLDAVMTKALAPVTPSSTLKKSATRSDVETGGDLVAVVREPGRNPPAVELPERPASMPARNSIGSTRPPLRHASTQMNSFWSMPSIREEKWTRTHSYFALMGGFAMDTRGMSVNMLSEGRTRGTLTVFALKTIAKNAPMVLPDLSKSEITDKSKANGLAKTLVCLQASWFCAQMLGRLATDGNPISLLELNTFLHAICCLATYGAWLWKPLDISEPELIIAASKEDHLRFYARCCLGNKLYCKIAGPDATQDKDFQGVLTRGRSPDVPSNLVSHREGVYTFALSLIHI